MVTMLQLIFPAQLMIGVLYRNHWVFPLKLCHYMSIICQSWSIFTNFHGTSLSFLCGEQISLLSFKVSLFISVYQESENYRRNVITTSALPSPDYLWKCGGFWQRDFAMTNNKYINIGIVPYWFCSTLPPLLRSNNILLETSPEIVYIIIF